MTSKKERKRSSEVSARDYQNRGASGLSLVPLFFKWGTDSQGAEVPSLFKVTVN